MPSNVKVLKNSILQTNLPR